MILVVAEQRNGALSRTSWEAVAAAQQLAAGRPIGVAVLGGSENRIDSALRELAGAAVQDVLAVVNPALETYTADGYVSALEEVVRALSPSMVLLPHTYQTRDFAPRLAVRLGAALITDVTAVKQRDGVAMFVRPMFQGKLTAQVVPEGPAPHLVTVQVGSFRADHAVHGTSPAPVRTLDVSIDSSSIRQRPETPFREARQAVDLSQAERIVAIGRGIKDQSRIPLARELAEALDAELAASRPVCDAGWLPMERQVGSSGQTVSPKLYVALGISGAIQHLVGMKGSKVIVAVNKDPDAPIFEVADIGIVGDLFEIVPAMTSALKDHERSRG